MIQKKSCYQDLLRALMVFLIVYYLPTANFIALQETVSSSAGVVQAPEESLGGSENAAVMENVSLEAESLPEPEEFSRPHMLIYSSYTVKVGDNLSEIAKRFALNVGTLISTNDIKHPRNLPIGKTLKIPNQDGIIYKAGRNDTLEAVSKKHKADPEAVKIANELFSDKIGNGNLFLPGAIIPWEDRQEQQIIRDIFLWPVRGYISSYYGYRRSPFTGVRTFHDGLDIAAPTGTSVKAAMSGRVSAAGYDEIFGNFVAITHQSGYRTLYGHMSFIHTRIGAYVNAGEQIGEVGSTGQSTGPHLHFTVYSNGKRINPRVVLR